MQPAFNISADGRQGATEAIRARLFALAVTDEAGRQSDSAEIRLDDRRGDSELPRKGSELEISIGYKGGSLTGLGRSAVNEIGRDGPPCTLLIRSKGADMRSSLKAQKTRSWDDVLLGDLVAGIASEHGLDPRVGASLNSIRIPHLDQTEESDLNLLKRLARDYDVVAPPASGALLLVPRGEASTASGEPMPTVEIVRGDASHRPPGLGRQGGVPSRVGELVRRERSRQLDREQAGSGEPVFTLRRF